MSRDPEVDEEEPLSAFRRLKILASLVVYGIVLFIGLTRFVFTVTTMATNSMAPTLQIGPEGSDAILVDRLSLRSRPPRRGEIVYFQDVDGVWLLKRVVGLPGETLKIRDGAVWIDGLRITDPSELRSISYVPGGHLTEKNEVVIAKDHFFVLGDDSADSYDSRFWGALSADRLVGLARWRVWPPGRVAVLTPSS